MAFESTMAVSSPSRIVATLERKARPRPLRFWAGLTFALTIHAVPVALLFWQMRNSPHL